MKLNNVHFCDQVWLDIFIIYLKKYIIIGFDILRNFLIYPYKQKYMFMSEQCFPEKCPSSSHLGGKPKLSHFYPEIDSCPAYFGADITNKSD